MKLPKLHTRQLTSDIFRKYPRDGEGAGMVINVQQTDLVLLLPQCEHYRFDEFDPLDHIVEVGPMHEAHCTGIVGIIRQLARVQIINGPAMLEKMPN